MSLKLFRSTGYHSILAPGEASVAMHPGWAVTATSLWIGFACNPWFWRSLGEGGNSLTAVALQGAAIAGAVGSALSLFGWRRTFKPIATLMLAAAALTAAGVWTQDVALTATLEAQRPTLALPSWASLFGWQVPTLLGLLGLLPMIWLWNAQLRRLSGSTQLRANLTGIALGATITGSAMLAVSLLVH
ncbi:phosphoethanolamine transferase domain-containing protein [Ramlibacter sp. MMS24-I3-19]|uniref:phosphoethanolamine transferase domain-containing protein n=1 Tax=Ramlibacter sp. MMS24-I3-19 TaxID=3416606 RepID=UPI003D0333D5